MEDIVRDRLEELISKQEGICACKKCKLDMIAWALNRIPSMYVVTDKGRIYTKLKQLEMQSRADIVKELVMAMTVISKSPRH